MIGKMFASSVDSSYLSDLTLHCVFNMGELFMTLWELEKWLKETSK